MIDEEQKVEIIVSTCYPLMFVVYILIHELFHLIIYKLINNDNIRSIIDKKWDSIHRYTSMIAADGVKS